MKLLIILVFTIVTLGAHSAEAIPISKPVKETAKHIVKKFGPGAAGRNIDALIKNTSAAVAKYGDDCLPFLRNTGHEGFRMLDKAGHRAPDIIDLYKRTGNKGLWIIRDSKKTDLFLKYGDNAASAMIKHPGIADNLIIVYGDKAATALNFITRENAQKLARLSADGSLGKMGRADELLVVIGKYGDSAMDFVWKHKGALAVTALLAKFLSDPEVFIKGVKELVAQPIIHEVGKNTNWTLIIMAVLSFMGFPFIIQKIKEMWATIKSRKTKTVSSPQGSGP